MRTKGSALLAAILFAIPTLAAADGVPICTDRPAKANAVCTVPPGKFQLETAPVGWVRSDAGGAETDLLAIAASVVKLGLSDRWDLQLGFTPYLRATTKENGGSRNASGFGDALVRFKHRLTADGARVQVAALPFVKLPMAVSGLGNGKVEGGLAVPVSMALRGPLTLTIGPELDLLADADGKGRHAALVNLVNLSAAVAPKLTLVGELWTMTNFDPEGTVTLVSADTAMAYAVSRRLQLDLGANFGLDRHTPDVELYVGASFRF